MPVFSRFGSRYFRFERRAQAGHWHCLDRKRCPLSGDCQTKPMESFMRLRSIQTLSLFSLFLCIGMTSSLQADYIQDNNYKMQAQQTGQTKMRSMLLAGSPAICKANYDQCMKGCDGAAQCSNQCMVNYNGCLR
jgi:hypothetical protein